MFNQTLLATIHAEQGEVERACAIGCQAAELTVDLKSQRARRRLTELRDHLGSYTSLPEVRDLAERTHVFSGS
ncbi:MAG: hypothetical protein ACRDMV_21060 [Streptosporangiales bacterium]